MIIKNHNNKLQIKPAYVNFITSFDIKSFNKQYNNHDIILVIDFDSNLIDVLDDWMIVLKKTNNFLIIVVDLIDEFLLKNKFFIFVPTLKESIDYIYIERINKDLGL